MFNLKKNKGFTLIEILLVVGFIALAGIGVYVVYDKVQATNAANKEVQNIRTIMAGITNLYAFSGNTPNTNVLTQENFINLGIFPEHMVNKETMTVTSSFKEAVEISSNANFSRVNIRYNNVPKDACLKLVTPFVSDAGRIVVGGYVVLHDGTKIDQGGMNTTFDMGNAASACNRTNGNVVPTIALFFSTRGVFK